MQDLTAEKKHLQLIKKNERALREANDQLQQEVIQRRQAEEELHKSNETIRALLNATPDDVFLVDRHGRLLTSNQAFANRHGKAAAKDMVGHHLRGFVAVDVVERYAPKFVQVIQTGKAVRFEAESNGRIADNTFYPVLTIDGKVAAIAAFSRDITDGKQTEEKLKLAVRIIEGSNEAIMITDVNGNIVDVNEAMCKLTGYSREEVIGKNPRIMKSGRHLPGFYQHMWLMLTETGQWQGEVWDRKRNGEVYPKLLSISAVHNNQGGVTHYVAFFSDITKIKQTEKRLRNWPISIHSHGCRTGCCSEIVCNERWSTRCGAGAA